MANQSGTFGLATLLVVAGLLVMLYGVSLNNGTAFNTPMVAGGVVVAAAIGLLVWAVSRLEPAHGPA